MNLSISNIAWLEQDDEKIYGLMKKFGYTGLEIAPTRIIADSPYDNIASAVEKTDSIKKEYGFCIPSMQSIWYGKTEKIFGTEEERKSLIEYTKKAIDWAQAIGCRNLVFGCPRNRAIPEGGLEITGINFFREIGNYAANHSCVIGMEANPPIYNTNYINDTSKAFELIKEVDSKGFLLNLDVGTMIANEEDIGLIEENAELISHVHISEPGLVAIQNRQLHRELLQMLADKKYTGFVSIEMGNSNGLSEVSKAIEYVAHIAGECR